MSWLSVWLVKVEDFTEIINAKTQTITLGVMNQAQMELRHNEMPNSAEKVKEEPAMTRLKTSLEHLMNIVVPFGLELNFLVSVEKTVQGTIDKYNDLRRTLLHSECYVIPCYKSEKPVMDLVEWDDSVELYTLQARLSSSSSVELASKRPCVQVPAA